MTTASLSLVPPPLISSSSCDLTLGRQGIGELGRPLEPVHLAEQPIRYGYCGTGMGCYYMPFTLDTIDFPSGCPLQMRKDMVTLLLMRAAKIASPPPPSDGGGVGF